MMVLLTDKKERVYEGVKLHCGPLFALQAHTTFEHKYTKKHGTCLEYVIAYSQEVDAFRQYTQRESKVYERYMMMHVHEYDKQFKPQSTYVFEGGVRE